MKRAVEVPRQKVRTQIGDDGRLGTIYPVTPVHCWTIRPFDQSAPVFIGLGVYD